MALEKLGISCSGCSHGNTAIGDCTQKDFQIIPSNLSPLWVKHCRAKKGFLLF